VSTALLVCTSIKPGGVPLIARLAHRFDIVIGVDGGAAACLEAGVTPTLIVGDLDSLPAFSLARALDLGVEIRRFPADKDRTDLALALHEARTMGVGRVTVTGMTGGRLDHALGALAALVSAADLSPRICEPDMNGWLLSQAGRQSVRVVGDGTTLSIVPFSPSARVSASGVRWPLQDADISSTDTLGISNVVGNDGALVSVDAGIVYVLSPRTHVAPAEESPV
jgi:thiamine pyrophosphokinase